MRAKITVRGGRPGGPSRGQDIGVYAEIDGRRAVLPVHGFVLRCDGRKTVAVCTLEVDEVDLVDIETVENATIVPRFVDKPKEQTDDNA